jgi:hypothetical protein
MYERKENMDLVNKYLIKIISQDDELQTIKNEYEKILKKYNKKYNSYELQNKIYQNLIRK